MWAQAQTGPVEIKLRVKNDQLKDENKGDKEKSDCCWSNPRVSTVYKMQGLELKKGMGRRGPGEEEERKGGRVNPGRREGKCWKATYLSFGLKGEKGSRELWEVEDI